MGKRIPDDWEIIPDSDEVTIYVYMAGVRLAWNFQGPDALEGYEGVVRLV